MQETEARFAPSKEHSPWLDWLRLIAALIVMLAHVRGAVFVDYGSLDTQNLATALFYFVTRLGHQAVMVFFVLSGFLVGGVALKRGIAKDFDPRSYAVDRAGRIGTPLIPAIFFTAVVAVIVNGEVSWGAFTGNLLALQGVVVPPLSPNPPLWSLSYEIWFYVLGGAIASLMIRFNWPAVALAALASAMFLKLQPHYLLIWFMGAAAYFYRPKKLLSLQIITAIAISAGGAVLSQMAKSSKSLPELGLSLPITEIVLALGIALLVPCIRQSSAPEKLAKLGAAAAAPSYTLYLTHYPLMRLLQHFGLDRHQITLASVALYAAMIGICLVISLLFYWTFEKNTQLVKSWLRTTFVTR